MTLVFKGAMGYKYFYEKAHEEWKMDCDRRFGPGSFLVPQCLSLPRPKIA